MYNYKNLFISTLTHSFMFIKSVVPISSLKHSPTFYLVYIVNRKKEAFDSKKLLNVGVNSMYTYNKIVCVKIISARNVLK
jgi:hypothetical protein